MNRSTRGNEMRFSLGVFVEISTVYTSTGFEYNTVLINLYCLGNFLGREIIE
jgi:hypothetical protein